MLDQGSWEVDSTKAHADDAEQKVFMPPALTAEMGAKSLFSGEFKESTPVTCPDCEGHGGECETCDGYGELMQDVPVSWITIKAIYALAIKEYGEVKK